MKQTIFVLALLYVGVSVGTLLTKDNFFDRGSQPKYSLITQTGELTESQKTGIILPIFSKGTKHKYLCNIPPPLQKKTEEDIQVDNAVKFEEIIAKIAQKCLMRSTGWWVYEICAQKHVRQFHQEPSKPIRPQDDYILGKYAPSIPHKFEMGYVSEWYTDGTECELTGEKRKTEVRYICAPEGTTHMEITEPSSCQYTMTLGSPYVCELPKYKPKPSSVQEIICARTATPEELASQHKRQESLAQALLDDDEDEPVAAKPAAKVLTMTKEDLEEITDMVIDEISVEDLAGILSSEELQGQLAERIAAMLQMERLADEEEEKEAKKPKEEL